MKKKVLFFAPMEYDTTSFYRCAGVLPYLSCDDYEIVNGSYITDWNWATFVGIDVFFLHRPCNQDHLNMMLLAKDMNIPVVVDYDDNLFAITLDNPTYQYYMDAKLAILKTLRVADEVWVTTAGVKKAYEKFNQNCIVIPNCHNDYIFPVNQKMPFNTNTKHVIWRGGKTHEADVYEHADNLVKIINSNTDWTFNFWGAAFTYLEQRCGQNYIRRDRMEIIQYFRLLLDYNPNVMIVPLVDNDFNRSKSNIAFIEGTYAGAAVFGNTNMPEFDNEWIGDISNFLSEPIDTWNDLKYMNEASWQYITDNLLLSKVNKLRHEAIMKYL